MSSKVHTLRPCKHLDLNRKHLPQLSHVHWLPKNFDLRLELIPFAKSTAFSQSLNFPHKVSFLLVLTFTLNYIAIDSIASAWRWVSYIWSFQKFLEPLYFVLTQFFSSSLLCFLPLLSLIWISWQGCRCLLLSFCGLSGRNLSAFLIL